MEYADLVDCQYRMRFAEAGLTLVVTPTMREDKLPDCCFYAALMDDRTDRAVAGVWVYGDYCDEGVFDEALSWAENLMVSDLNREEAR